LGLVHNETTSISRYVSTSIARLVTVFFFFQQEAANRVLRGLVGPEMCNKDRICVPVLNNAKKQEVELVIIFLTEQTPVSVK
uniref:hypothetical protein n=1 Tax=Escherichia coli TaxID=562 RepID=UPI002B241F24